MMFDTFRFEDRPADIMWRTLKEHELGKVYLPILKRMLNCDYQVRTVDGLYHWT